MLVHATKVSDILQEISGDCPGNIQRANDSPLCLLFNVNSSRGEGHLNFIEKLKIDSVCSVCFYNMWCRLAP